MAADQLVGAPAKHALPGRTDPLEDTRVGEHAAKVVRQLDEPFELHTSADPCQMSRLLRGGLSPLFANAERTAAGKLRVGAERLLDAQELVVLRDAIRARRRTRLDLAAARRDGQVGDR